MASNPTKWKLNKAEQKQLDDEANSLYEAKIAEGINKLDAQREKAAFIERRSWEIKGGKAAKSAAKDAEQKRKTGPAGEDDEVDRSTKDVSTRADFNTDYIHDIYGSTTFMEAKKVIGPPNAQQDSGWGTDSD